MNRKLIYLISFVVLLIAASSVQAFVTVTTAVGNGADTFVGNDSKSSPTATHGTATELECRYAGSDLRFRATYLRFDLSNVGGDMTGATLTFEATYLKSTTGRVLDVNGLTDETLDLWNEGTTNYNNAPGMLPASLGDYAVDPNKLTWLGTITTPNKPDPAVYPVRFSSNDVNLPLGSFLNSDTNKLVTFVLINSQGTASINCEDRVASKEHATFLEPTLTLPNAFLLQASNPNPADGSILDSTTSVLLQWQQGGFAAQHDIYFASNWADVNNAKSSDPCGPDKVYKGRQSVDANSYTVSNLIMGITYYWRIDEVNDVNIWRGDIWSFKILPKIAWEPAPPNDAGLVAPKITLRWRAGSGAVTGHRVYLGDDFNDVNNAPVDSNALPYRAFVVPSDNPNWNPAKAGVTLGLNTTYYWRIDEVNDPCAYKGEVWSFTTVPTAPPEPSLVGWWRFDGDANDSSGHWNNGTATSDLIPPILPTYVDDLQFYPSDRQISLAGNNYKQYVDLPIGTLISSLTNSTFAMWVNVRASGSTLRWQKFFDFGTSTTNYMRLLPRYSDSPPTHFEIKTTDGRIDRVGWGYNGEGGPGRGSYLPLYEWHHVAVTIDDDANTFRLYVDATQVGENTDANLTPSNLGFTTMNWLGKSIDLTIGGLYITSYLDDFRIYDRALSQAEILKVASPTEAWAPNPANNTTGVEPSITLTWKPGNSADKHDVYLGTDFNDVNNASRGNDPCGVLVSQDQSEPNYRPGKHELLQLSTTYYWRVDEVNNAVAPYIWKGPVWNFTTGNYFSVDNFESYNPSIANVWKPGGGAKVSLSTNTVHEGTKAMAIDYNNTASPYYSEADANSTGLNSLDLDFNTNWLAGGVKALSLYFLGYPDVKGGVIWTQENPPLGPYSATISGSGVDIWSTSDQFHYAHRQLTDVGSITARVDNMDNTDAWAKVGLMMRNTLDPGSKYVMVAVTPGNGVTFQWRSVDDGSSSSSKVAGLTAPHWVKLTREWLEGDVYYICAEHANDVGGSCAGDWEQIGSDIDTVLSEGWGYELYIGLCVTSHNAGVICDANLSNVTFGDLDPEYSELTDNWQSQDIGIPYNDPEPMYATLQDNDSNATLYYPGTYNPNYADANVTQIGAWTEWNIDLNDFRVKGVNLDKVQRMYIGVGDRAPGSSSGTVYVDDIRLYLPRFVAGKLPRIPADLVYNGVINEADLDVLTENWLQAPTDPNINLYGGGTIDFRDFAELGKYWCQQQVWPTW